ncbi:MAG: ribosomal protein S18-alanine N-acetyltransferase [Bacilli bacterium]|nr:ribosomal protein S18-alanine N-acetyltransferase [Bacilli bacterium]
MVREALNQDFNRINEIGLLIKDNFSTVYQIDEAVKKDYTHIYVYEDDNNVLGFIHIENHFEITDVINIAVDKNYQSRGIGKILLQYVIDNTEADKIMLEVKENNIPAIKLYESLDFKQIHVRPNYYEGNIDALIMERSI